MKSRLLVVVAVLFFSAGTHGATRNRPNILFLFADDMRADTIRAHGNSHIDTPHLDQLAARGFSFRRNYVFGGNSGAVCVPSRAMLMSGKSWFNIDAPTLKGEKLLPELLGENGYITFGTGKWHNGQESWLRAFQQGKNVMFGGMSDHTKVPVRDRTAAGKLTPADSPRSFRANFLRTRRLSSCASKTTTNRSSLMSRSLLRTIPASLRSNSANGTIAAFHPCRKTSWRSFLSTTA